MCPREEREKERKNPENPKEPDSDRRPRPRRTPKPIVLDPDRRPRSRFRLRADRLRSIDRLRTISPLVEPSHDWIMNFFFLGFICVSRLRNEIIYLFGS